MRSVAPGLSDWLRTSPARGAMEKTMGANTFETTATGATAKAAFDAATAQARHDYGHAGYTGTIAEKTAFTLIAVPEGEEPAAFARRLVDDCDPRVDDKWGPAGCVKIADGEWLFFGWASS